MSLDGYAGAETVGLVMADKLGYFDDAGLNVWIGRPAIPSSTVYYVATRMDEFGITRLPRVPIARENGLPVVAVGSVIQEPTAAMIWLKDSGVRTVADLKGETIGLPEVPYLKELLGVVLEDAGLTLTEVTVQPVGYRMVPALLKGEVDAIFGGSPNIEGAVLASRGAEPVVKRVQDLGVPDYEELVVITREDRAAADPEAIGAFMSAVKRGTAAAVKHPRAAATLIEKSAEADPQATRGEIEAQLKATLPLLSRTGRLDPGKAGGLLDWMREQKMIERTVPVSEVFGREGGGITATPPGT
ncbi:MAG TPA: ABC transporter substrate-binding protein [Solirubrobacterales bacterium]